MSISFWQYMLQLHASKLVNRKNKAKDDDTNLPLHDSGLNIYGIKDQNICLKVEYLSKLVKATKHGTKMVQWCYLKGSSVSPKVNLRVKTLHIKQPNTFIIG